jgi:hypothetical protein
LVLTASKNWVGVLGTGQPRDVIRYSLLVTWLLALITDHEAASHVSRDAAYGRPLTARSSRFIFRRLQLLTPNIICKWIYFLEQFFTHPQITPCSLGSALFYPPRHSLATEQIKRQLQSPYGASPAIPWYNMRLSHMSFVAMGHVPYLACPDASVSSVTVAKKCKNTNP